MGYSPWGHKESDTTEKLSTAHVFIKIIFHWEANREINTHGNIKQW